jgi:hypothetical protein
MLHRDLAWCCQHDNCVLPPLMCLLLLLQRLGTTWAWAMMAEV